MTHSKPGASTPNLGAQGLPSTLTDGTLRLAPLAGRALHNSEPVEPTRSCLARPSHGGSRALWPNLLNSVSGGGGSQPITAEGRGPCYGLQKVTQGSDPRNWGSLQRAKGRRGAKALSGGPRAL